VTIVSGLIKQYDLRQRRREIPPVLITGRESGAFIEGERDASIELQVKRILKTVAAKGDPAVAAFTKKFDKVSLNPRQFEIKEKEISGALGKIGDDVRRALEKALENIAEFHKRGMPRSWEYESADGVVLGERITPIERVGVYVPGGKAFYPSSLLMTVVPAKIAGCTEIVVVSPPSYKGSIHPAVLAAASLAGATRVFRIGGAQAIAALAYGTRTVPAVDKIVGPGNVYVTVAKRLVSHTVQIDKEAGPSEIVIIADDTANPRWVAADMVSQAEHGEDSVAILLTDSEQVARDVESEIERQVGRSPRRELVAEALQKYGAIVLVSDLDQAVELSNMRAPEHLSIMTASPKRLLKLIKNAGAIFVGPYSPVAVGDYIAGPSHVLPTGGTARFASALTVNDFLKRSTEIRYTREKLLKEAQHIVKLAETEGLAGHAESIKLRLKQ